MNIWILKDLDHMYAASHSKELLDDYLRTEVLPDFYDGMRYDNECPLKKLDDSLFVISPRPEDQFWIERIPMINSFVSAN